MQPSRNKARQALNQILKAIVPQQASQTIELEDSPNNRINLCIELLKTEASEAAALIAECAPHGKPMLAQAQKKLEHLEALKILETVVSDIYRG